MLLLQTVIANNGGSMIIKNTLGVGLFIIIISVLCQIIDDISLLNKTSVRAIVYPQTIEELQATIKASNGPFSIAGARCSQGGQTIVADGVVIDMRHLSKIQHLDVHNKTITVQTGATWRDIQKFIDPHNLSIKIMQSYSDFSLGGSLSVNAHGRYIGCGPLIETVRNITILLANGSLIKASRTENEALFRAAIGGYGILGDRKSVV